MTIKKPNKKGLCKAECYSALRKALQIGHILCHTVSFSEIIIATYRSCFILSWARACLAFSASSSSNLTFSACNTRSFSSLGGKQVGYFQQLSERIIMSLTFTANCKLLSFLTSPSPVGSSPTPLQIVCSSSFPPL